MNTTCGFGLVNLHSSNNFLWLTNRMLRLKPVLNCATFVSFHEMVVRIVWPPAGG